MVFIALVVLSRKALATGVLLSTQLSLTGKGISKQINSLGNFYRFIFYKLLQFARSLQVNILKSRDLFRILWADLYFTDQIFWHFTDCSVKWSIFEISI